MVIFSKLRMDFFSTLMFLAGSILIPLLDMLNQDFAFSSCYGIATSIEMIEMNVYYGRRQY